MSPERKKERKKEKKMPFVVATYVYASSQGQRTHSARTNLYIYFPPGDNRDELFVIILQHMKTKAMGRLFGKRADPQSYINRNSALGWLWLDSQTKKEMYIED